MIILEYIIFIKIVSFYIFCSLYIYEIYGFVVNIVLLEVVLFLYFIVGNMYL